MITTWILVAHGSFGKILEIGKNSKDVIVKNEFNYPKITTTELGASSRQPESVNENPQQQTMDYGEESEDHKRRMLAKEIAHYLGKAHAEHNFGKLILVASPSLLGHLRNALPQTVSKTLAHQLDKNFLSQELSNSELVEKIRTALNLIHL